MYSRGRNLSAQRARFCSPLTAVIPISTKTTSLSPYSQTASNASWFDMNSIQQIHLVPLQSSVAMKRSLSRSMTSVKFLQQLHKALQRAWCKIVEAKQH